MPELQPLRQIHLYDEGTAPTLDVCAVAAYLSEQTGCRAVHARGSFLLEHAAEDQFPEIARGLAALKVIEVNSPWREREPSHGEVEFERRRLAKADQGPHGVVYEGFGLQVMLRNLMTSAGVATPALHTAHIAFTNRLVGTWGDDLRYHLRTIILGLPAIISTTGLVEAPAKPREFYLAQQQLGPAGQSEYALARLKEQFRRRFLDYDDPRLAEVAKGYAMQAIAYQFTGEAFCEDPTCRLFNAHWQEEMLKAQLGDRYCGRHRAWLSELREGAGSHRGT
jgi:hypothetical protein